LGSPARLLSRCNIQGAIDYAEPVPTEGDAAFIDDTNYPKFGAANKAAE